MLTNPKIVMPQPLSRASLGSSRPSTLVEGGIYMPGRAPKSPQICLRQLEASSPQLGWLPVWIWIKFELADLDKIIQIVSIMTKN